MTQTLDQLNYMLTQMGSNVTIHTEDGGAPCPCRTYEGNRDPSWHLAHPTEPVCNEEGFLADVTEFVVKASIQAFRRRGSFPAQRADRFLEDVQQDDRLGIFPVTWDGNTIDFSTWSEAGEDYVLHDGKRYVVIAADKIPDVDGDPNHHWEVGLRLVKTARPT